MFARASPPTPPAAAVPLGPYAFLLAFAFLTLDPHLALAEPAALVRPSELPYGLTAGWEEADDGVSWRPVDPMHVPGPFGDVRFYRIRVDLTACRGIALALSIPSLRDADETLLDGARIGGLGGFPPAVDPANLQARLYPLPTDITNRAGTHMLTMRIYHGPRSSSVFRGSPSLERLAYTAARAGLEQTLAAVAGSGLTVAAVFTLLFFGQRREPIFLDFAAFALLLVVYLMSAHSAWSRWALPRATPFRVAAVAATLLWLAYFDAARRLLAVRLPVRFRAYVGGFVAYAVLSAVTPDIGLLVIPTRLARLLLIVCVLDLLSPTLHAIRQGRAGARGILVGYVVFVWGVQVVEAGALSASSFYALVGIVLVLLAVGVYTVGLKQNEARAAAVLEERSRIARDIHDTIAQGLVGVSIQLESAEATLLDDPSAASGALGRARRLVRACLEEARRSIWDLRRIAPGPDLGTALRRTAERLTEGTPVRAEFEVMGRPRALSGLVENHLLHIGEEAVSNVVRHARASQVRIAVAFTSEAVELSVEDDGCGFAPEPDGAAPDGRFGILGMRERTQQLRGELVIETGRQQGTRVAVVVPFG